jgi:hypothetical protein
MALMMSVAIKSIISCAECPYAECHYAECHCAEYHYTECHYSECQYADYRGTVFVTLHLL